jgi:hypothetical protein
MCVCFLYFLQTRFKMDCSQSFRSEIRTPFFLKVSNRIISILEKFGEIKQEKHIGNANVPKVKPKGNQQKAWYSNQNILRQG